MIIVTIGNIKKFMNMLLKDAVFDGYELHGMTVRTITTFDIAGTSEDGEQKYCLWEAVKPFALTLIKGGVPPKYMKIKLCLSDEKAAKISENAATLFLTITYENGAATVLTGTSQKKFSLEERLDNIWDNHVLRAFSKYDIGAEQKMAVT